MAQISRPFQLALAAVALLGVVWVVALRRPSTSSSEAKSVAEHEVAAATPAKPAKPSTTKASGSGAGGSAGTYKGSAPGVAGLTAAIAKARGAAATAKQNEKQLQAKSNEASSSTAVAPAQPASSTAASAPAAPRAAVKPATPAQTKTTTPAGSHASNAAPLALQHSVEAALKQGRVAVLLFWSPTGADDVAVRHAVAQLATHDHRVAVYDASAKQVASFGSITRGVQVFGTPTILIVGQHGSTRMLTGLQDAYAIRQAISETRHG